MFRAYGLLALAIVAEVIATSALKASAGFTRLGPSVAVVLGYAVAFVSLSMCMKAGVGVGVAYAVWSGVGILLVAGIGIVVYHESVDLAAFIGFALITVGAIVLTLFSKTAQLR